MRQTISKLALVALLAFHPLDASAQSTSADFNAGSVKIGYDSTACSGSIEGAIRYNSASGIEFCNGTAWTATGGGCVAPSSCPNVGDVCTDGSLFAGFMLYETSCEPLFAAGSNEATGNISFSSSGADTGADDNYDGRVNVAWIIANANINNYAAMKACENSTMHGKTDWYLPSRIEIDLMGHNLAASGGFGSNDYWSSTETEYDPTDRVWIYQAWEISTYIKFKTSDTARVRCVRRD